MNIAPELMFRSKGSTYAIGGLDAEDLAFIFMEEEVGRFDWQSNWEKIKATGTATQRVQDWLNTMQIDNQNPDELVRILDTVAAERSGRWL
jgi:hypothetical protein